MKPMRDLIERQDALRHRNQRRDFLRANRRWLNDPKRRRHKACRKYVAMMLYRLGSRQIFDAGTGEIREFREELTREQRVMWSGFFAALFWRFQDEEKATDLYAGGNRPRDRKGRYVSRWSYALV